MVLNAAGFCRIFVGFILYDVDGFPGVAGTSRSWDWVFYIFLKVNVSLHLLKECRRMVVGLLSLGDDKGWMSGLLSLSTVSSIYLYGNITLGIKWLVGNLWQTLQESTCTLCKQILLETICFFPFTPLCTLCTHCISTSSCGHLVVCWVEWTLTVNGWPAACLRSEV